MTRKKRRKSRDESQNATSTRMGRPKKRLTPELEKVLYKCASRGFTQEQIADLLGIPERTLIKRLSEEPRLATLIKRAKADTLNLATGKLVQAIRAGQAWAICFYLKTRAGWSERVMVGGEIKHTMDEQFAGAVASAPKYIQDVIKSLPSSELVKIKKQYASMGVSPDGKLN